MKKLILVLATCLACSVYGQTHNAVQIVTDVEAKTTGQNGNTINNCYVVVFHLVGFSGTIGSATYSNISGTVPLQATGGNVFRGIPYTITGGTLYLYQSH